MEDKKKLKTLKDIDSPDRWGDFVSRFKLKQEAIKWIKDIRDSIPSTYQKKEDIRCFSESWIKHFFNITEEDLK